MHAYVIIMGMYIIITLKFEANSKEMATIQILNQIFTADAGSEK